MSRYIIDFLFIRKSVLILNKLVWTDLLRIGISLLIQKWQTAVQNTAVIEKDSVGVL